MVLSACTTAPRVSPEAALAQKQFTAKMDECDARTFKRAIDRSNCWNNATNIILPFAGGDADLLRYMMAKRIEIARKYDARKITKDQANSELEYVAMQLTSEENRRRAERMRVVAQLMAAQNQNNALQSIANSQARMAGAAEDYVDFRFPNSANDPFVRINRLNREISR